jgi:hypothetical protein
MDYKMKGRGGPNLGEVMRWWKVEGREAA